MNIQDHDSEEEKIAKEIMEFVRRTLLIHMRYFDRAIYALPFRQHDQIMGVGTDGRFLYYSNYYAVQMFRYDKGRLHRDYLHNLLHCIFRHFDVNPGINRAVWDLSCDIAVENLIHELGLKHTAIEQEASQMEYISALAQKLNLLSAEKIYHLFMEDDSIADLFARLDLPENRKSHAFSRDDHTFWYPVKADSQVRDYEEDTPAKVFDDLDVTNADQIHLLNDVELTEEWKKIADIINVDLETESKNKGIQAGSLCWQLRVAGRDKVDYRAFLKKFSVSRESLGTNMDEFDYVYYTYGMELYRDMPLIEPLEYREDRRVREFVIAIDTSGSVSRQRVRRFLESTFSILKSSGSFSSEMKVYIIQCDAAIQHVELIETPEDLNHYMEELMIYGYGGTDFRPVFEYVDRLLEERMLTKLEGMIYFTDGLGIYPKHPPAYRTAFIFTDEGLENVSDFPAWAMKIILTEEEIDCLE